MFASQNVVPTVLLDAGYRFTSATLNEALIRVLG